MHSLPIFSVFKEMHNGIRRMEFSEIIDSIMQVQGAGRGAKGGVIADCIAYAHAYAYRSLGQEVASA